jgi:endonuclease/exonuclease/phosphatase (EEP) superfamily protein YafD
MKKSLIATTLFISILTACISVPKEQYTIRQRDKNRIVTNSCGCDTNLPTAPELNISENKLDGNGFSLMTWNIMKNSKTEWKKDFRKLSMNQDLLFIQEADLTENLAEILRNGQYHWDLSVAFKCRGSEIGVLTASKVKPFFLCTFRSKEPLTFIPKTIVVTLYALSGTDQSLAAVNLHLINFSLSTSEYRSQLHQLEAFLSKHEGPIIVAGDFNSWKNKRMEVVNGFVENLKLNGVTFKINNRATFFGHNVDFVFYRGLEPITAVTPGVKSSDHNPMLVTFKLKKLKGPNIE